MVVSSEQPPRMAQMEEPAPRWQLTMRGSVPSASPRISGARWATQA